MSALIAVVMLHQTVLSANPAYQAAVADAQAQRRPLLVLVGAQWCPGCRVMKQTVVPSLARRGALKAVSFAAVDTDREAELAGQLMRGSSIPQLIAFSRQPDGKWHRDQITGAASEAEVQSLIARALKAQQTPVLPTAASAIGN